MITVYSPMLHDKYNNKRPLMSEKVDYKSELHS